MQFQSAVFKYMYIIICNHDNKTTRKRDVDDRFYDDFFFVTGVPVWPT